MHYDYQHAYRRKNGAYLVMLAWAAIIAITLLPSLTHARFSSGCADGTREGLLRHTHLAVCAGHWTGHVENGTHLCAPGWKVCSWKQNYLLKNITWSEAISVGGCYAFDAAQDGGTCQECRSDVEQDDMAGIGRGCAQQNKGQTSCISGGRIDASCCVDAHFHKACMYQDGLMDGVLCCRMPARTPRLVVKPRPHIHVFNGRIFLLTCKATGMPPPRMRWYKDGRLLTQQNSRISVLTSGDLLVTLTRTSDTGMYTCEVVNEEGIDMANSYVTVTDYVSGCADRSTEGLSHYRDVHACAGKWLGHVKRGRQLCARGWTVCSPKDRDTLADLSWKEATRVQGCYAYNAANSYGKCTRCYRRKMAGLGKRCGRYRPHKKSCLAAGRIDVYMPKRLSSCTYQPGKVTGVLCCRKKRRNLTENKDKNVKLTCDPPCRNDGYCIGPNKCHCHHGYKGAMCQIVLCRPPCGASEVCSAPDKCTCKPGVMGKMCRRRAKNKCRSTCLNGGRCRRGRCKCSPTHWGTSCQHLFNGIVRINMNRTER